MSSVSRRPGSSAITRHESTTSPTRSSVGWRRLRRKLGPPTSQSIGAADVPEQVGEEIAALAADRADGPEHGFGCGRAARFGPGAHRVVAVLRVEVAARDRAFDPPRDDLVAVVRLDRHPHRLLEPHQAARHELADGRVVRDEVVLEAFHQRARDVGRHGRDETQPERRQSRREHGHGDDARPAPDEPAVAAHDLLVGHGVRPAGVEHASRGLIKVRDGDEVGEQVRQRDRRGSRTDPGRRDHDRQVVHEVANDFKGGGSRAR